MKSLATLLIGSALAFGASASTVSFNFSNPLAAAEISQTGNLGLFDSSLGILTGATIVVNGATLMSFSGTNTAAEERSATLTSVVDLLWASSLSALNPLLADRMQMLATSGSQSYADGETKNFGPFNLTDSKTDDLSTMLASLQVSGGGAFAVTCRSFSGFEVRGGLGDIGSDYSTNASCGASIEYTYIQRGTQVPEPASMALVGFGLLGLAASRRRAGKA